MSDAPARRAHDLLDLFKFLAATCVVAVHLRVDLTFAGMDFTRPWVRLAVPLFFLMSSYFFFSKKGVATRWGDVGRYVVRILRLYAVWFVLLLPFTLYNRWSVWSEGGFLHGCGVFLNDLLLGGTFLGSWFLMAMVFSTLLVFALWRRGGWGVMLLVCLLVHVAVSLGARYLPSYWPAWHGIRWIYVTSFPVALIYTALGVCAAVEARWERTIRRWGWWALLALFALACEWRLGFVWGISPGRDTYLLMPVAAFSLFMWAKNSALRIPGAKTLRGMSMMVYLSNAPALFCLMIVFWKGAGIDIGDGGRWALSIVLSCLWYGCYVL